MSNLAELRQAYNGPHNSLMDMCDAGSVYVEALESEVERLTRVERKLLDRIEAGRIRYERDLDAARAERDEARQVADHHAAWKLVAERQRDGLAKALEDTRIALTAVRPTLTRVSLHAHVSDALDAARDALAALPKEDDRE